MNRKFVIITFILVALLAALGQTPAAAQAESGPVVRAVLFYSPTCGHCHLVINDVLLPMLEEYGDQLVVLGVDVSEPGGGQLFALALDHFQLPPERGVVPTLIIEDTVLQGSGDIPAQFPGLVTDALEAGGNDWPAFPGMLEALPPELAGEGSPADDNPSSPSGNSDQNPPSPTAIPESPTAVAAGGNPPAEPAPGSQPSSPPAAEPADLREGVSATPPPDPIGFALGGLVLVGLVGSVGFTARWYGLGLRRLPRITKFSASSVGYAQSAWILVLSLAGLGVSGYLAYVEIGQHEAVCGPVGACNLVQGSAYAQIAGIPIAMLGLAFYLGTLTLWLTQRHASLPPETRRYAGMGLLALAILGALFSIYLTGLELFVIRAICLWCLSSAVLTAAILIATSRALWGLGQAGKQRE